MGRPSPTYPMDRDRRDGATVAVSDPSGERFAMSGPVPWSEVQYHLSRYQFAAGYAQGKNVLDVACGTGYGTCLLSQVSSHVIGADISLESLSSARRRYRNANLHYVCLDAQAFPFKEGSFEAVISLETVEHLVEPRGFLEECVRVLRPGGVLVLSTPNRDSHFWPLWIAQANPLIKRVLGRIKGLNTLLANPFHYREFTFHELKILVGSCVDIIGVYGMSKSSTSWPYRRGIVTSAGLGRVWWEAAKLVEFIGARFKRGPFIDASAVELRVGAPVKAGFIPFALEGPGPVEYLLIVGRKRTPRPRGTTSRI